MYEGSITDIVVSARMNLAGKGKIQGAIRSLFEDEGDVLDKAEAVAIAVGQFRSEMEDTIRSMETEASVKEERKRVNNVCNDISRICRELSGYSIKLKSRKGGFSYRTDKYVTPVKRTTVTATPVLPEIAEKDYNDKIDALTKANKSLNDMITAWEHKFLHDFDILIEDLIHQHGVDPIGIIVVDRIKKYREGMK